MATPSKQPTPQVTPPPPIDVKVTCPACGDVECYCKFVVTCTACQFSRTSALSTPEAAVASFRMDHEPTHADFVTVREK